MGKRTICYNCKYYEDKLEAAGEADETIDSAEGEEDFLGLSNLGVGHESISLVNGIKNRFGEASSQLGTKIWELTRYVSSNVEKYLHYDFEKCSPFSLDVLRKTPLPSNIILCRKCNCFSNTTSESLSKNYLVVQHGILDSPISMLDICFEILKDNTDLNIYIPYSLCGNTLHGIDITGSVLGLELIKFFNTIHLNFDESSAKNALFDSIDVSVIGHSFGSLILLSALTKLELDFAIVSTGKVKLNNFIGITSPLFGSYENYHAVNNGFDLFNTNLLKDLEYKTDGLINVYCCRSSDLLFAFNRIVLYSNAKRDLMVGPRTAISVPINVYTENEFKRIISKCSETPDEYHYLPNKPEVKYKYTENIKLIEGGNDENTKSRLEGEEYKNLIGKHKELLIRYLEYLKKLKESPYRRLKEDSEDEQNSDDYYYSHFDIELFKAIEEETCISLSTLSLRPSILYQLVIAFFELSESIDSILTLEDFEFDNLNHLHFHVLMTLFNMKDAKKKVERYIVFVPTLSPHRHIICKNSYLFLSNSYLELIKHMNSIKCFPNSNGD